MRTASEVHFVCGYASPSRIVITPEYLKKRISAECYLNDDLALVFVNSDGYSYY